MAHLIQPGDLLDLVTRLRKWYSERDSDAFLIDGSFAHYGAEVEAAAAAARPWLQGASDSVYQLVCALERTPEYKRQRKDSSDAIPISGRARP